MSQMLLRRMCMLLLLDGKLYISIKSIRYNVSFKAWFLYWSFVWMICPLMKVRCKSPLLLLCHCQFLLLWLILIVLVYLLECSHVGCIYKFNDKNCYIFFLDLSLDHYVLSFLSFVTVFILKSILSDMIIPLQLTLDFHLQGIPFSIPSLSVCMCP